MRASGRYALILVMAMTAQVRADLQLQADRTLSEIPRAGQVALGDLNQDGLADLVVSCLEASDASPSDDAAAGRVLVFYQQQGRLAARPDRQWKIARPWGLSIGDFDGDGRADLAVKDTGKKLHLFLGAESLDIDHVAPNINDCARLVCAGRLSPGGQADFLAGPVWRKWMGGDRFLNGYCFGPTASDNRVSCMADLDHDGHLDLVFGAGSEIRLYYGPMTNMTVRADEVGQYVPMPAPGSVQNLAVADLNGDARPDIAVALYDPAARTRSVAVWYQRAPMGFVPESGPDFVWSGLGGNLDTADLNHDGLADLIVSDSAAGRISVLIQHPDRPFSGTSGPADQVLRVRNQGVALGDINGDGLIDMAVSDGRTGIRFFVNDGQGATAPVAHRHGLDRPVPGPAPMVSAKPAKGAATAPAGSSAPTKQRSTSNPKVVQTPPLDLPPRQPGPDYEDPLRMPFYTGTILPSPQQVTYRDEFFALDRGELVLGPGLRPDGPLVAELRRRIERYGGRLTPVDSLTGSTGAVILLGNVPGAAPFLQGARVPDREQAYLMLCRSEGDRKVVVLQGRDTLGLLWAIASFNQLVHQREGRPVVRAADVFDYPEVANRGFIAGHWVDGLDYCVAFKLNKLVFQSALEDRSSPKYQREPGAWRRPLPESIRQDLAAYGHRLSPLGITWYAGINPIIGSDKIRSGDEQDFQAILEKACAVAQAGGHLCLKYDDHRFPISADDLRQFGSAREADVHLLTRLHDELHKRYPKARILFCPPFYWGPDSPAIYPEPRDEYLYALGKRLPPDIEIFWTGPRVKSGEVTASMVQWITERIGRKPLYWQNGFGSTHMFLYHYVTDPICVYRQWFYPDFWHQVDGYLINSSMPGSAAAVATCGDYCWNPNAYDADRSVREAATKLVGVDTYPALVALNRTLSWFDPFGLRRTPGAAQKLPEMIQRLAAVKAAWAELQQRNFRAVEAWTGMQRHVDQVGRFVEQLQRAPNLAAYRDDAAESQRQAAEEAGFTDKTDQFLSAYDFVGGAGPKHYALGCPKRLATWIYGAQSAHSGMEAPFTVEPFPPSGDYRLIVSAQDDDASTACRIRVWVNQTAIFEGPNPFPAHDWARHSFRIPGDCLQRQNRLRIETTEPKGRDGASPFFMLNYALIRRGDG